MQNNTAFRLGRPEWRTCLGALFGSPIYIAIISCAGSSCISSSEVMTYQLLGWVLDRLGRRFFRYFSESNRGFCCQYLVRSCVMVSGVLFLFHAVCYLPCVHVCAPVDTQLPADARVSPPPAPSTQVRNPTLAQRLGVDCASLSALMAKRCSNSFLCGAPVQV